MSIFRSYLSKNNTLIKNSYSNNSKNPVTEIVYGTQEKIVSRFIFDINIDNLKKRINEGFINPNNIIQHILYLTNTVYYYPEYITKKYYLDNTERASSFDLELFTITQPWDEGNGYDFIFNNIILGNNVNKASNWYYAKTNQLWDNEGAINNNSIILGVQHFDIGNENIKFDISNYVNSKIYGINNSIYGLGIKYTDYYENLKTDNRNVVAFHTKYTNTWYEPYVETIINDYIFDDRYYFYLDRVNSLYLYANMNGYNKEVYVDKVDIYDNNNNKILTFNNNEVIRISKGVYKINLMIDSSLYPDNVLFKDEWTVNVDGKIIKYNNNFLLLSNSLYLNFDNSSYINLNNYHINIIGIKENEKLFSGDIRKIKINVKELYPNQINNIPLNIEYRLFVKLGNNNEIDVIPFTLVNRVLNGYEFNLDTIWLIPQDYYLQIRIGNGFYYENKQLIKFSVINEGLNVFLNKKFY